MNQRLRPLRLLALCLALCLCCGAARAQETVILYHDIPFGAQRDEIVSQMRRLTGDDALAPESLFDSSSAYMTDELGLRWRLSFDCADVSAGLTRVTLELEGSAICRAGDDAQAAEMQRQAQALLRQMLEADRCLTELYGEPDCRYFPGMYQGVSGMHMFEDNQWHEKELLRLFRETGFLRTFAQWRNVQLELWFKTDGENAPLRVSLFFYPTPVETPDALIPCPVDGEAPVSPGK